MGCRDGRPEGARKKQRLVVCTVGLRGGMGQVSPAPSRIQTPAAGLGTGPVGTCSFPVPGGCLPHLPVQELSPVRGVGRGHPLLGPGYVGGPELACRRPPGASARRVSFVGHLGMGCGGWARSAERRQRRRPAAWLPGGGRDAPGNAGWAWRGGEERGSWRAVPGVGARGRLGPLGGGAGGDRGARRAAEGSGPEEGGRGRRARGRRRLGASRRSSGSSPRNRPPTAALGSRLPTPEPRRRLPLPAPGSSPPCQRQAAAEAPLRAGRLGLPGRAMRGRESRRPPARRRARVADRDTGEARRPKGEGLAAEAGLGGGGGTSRAWLASPSKSVPVRLPRALAHCLKVGGTP